MTETAAKVNLKRITHWLHDVGDIENLYLTLRVPTQIVIALKRYVGKHNHLTIQDFINETLEQALKDRGEL